MPNKNIEIRQNPTSCSDCRVRKLALFEAIPEKYIMQAQEKRSCQFKLGAKSNLYSEGEPCDHAYTLFDGWVLLYRSHSSGSIQGLRIALPGDFIGFMPMNHTTYNHGAMVITNSVFCSFSQQALHEMIDTHTGLASRIHSLHSEYMANCQSTILGLGRKSAEQRIAHLLADIYHRLEIRQMIDKQARQMPFPMTQEMLGDMTGLTPVHVNRVMRKLREEGAFDCARTTLNAIDIEKLIDIGEYVVPPRQFV